MSQFCVALMCPIYVSQLCVIFIRLNYVFQLCVSIMCHKGLELLRNNGAKPTQNFLPTIFLQKFVMQIFLLPMLIEEYQTIFSTS